jgi:hypothetical protein
MNYLLILENNLENYRNNISFNDHLC